VVITTRGRPNLVRRALGSVAAQAYAGPLRIVVVYDGSHPDWGLTRAGERPVLVMENWRTRGPAGARNAGILAVGDCDLVALCDDDDTWAPTKLGAQVVAIAERPGTLFATCAAEVEYDGRRTPQLTGLREVAADRLTRSFAATLRPSGFVASQRALVTEPVRGGIGLVDERAPDGGVAWDLLLRAARRAPIRHVDAPLVRVLWRRTDIDSVTCASRIRTLRWMIAEHPELRLDASAAARSYAELACWEAVAGDREAAQSWTRAALRAGWREPRLALAAAAASGLVRGRALRAILRRCGD
jgi:glycosyltransferase involved in cell wall biosynthesis